MPDRIPQWLKRQLYMRAFENGRYVLLLPRYGLVIDAKQCLFILLKNVRFGMTLKLDKQISTFRIKTLSVEIS